MPWWTPQRVENGLRRFARDFFAGRESELPTTGGKYLKLIPAAERGRRGCNRLYPPADAVLRHHESFAAAWWSIGILVVVRASRHKYELTPEIEATLRRIYSYGFHEKTRPPDVPAGPRAYARLLGLPGEVVTKWAQELGLARAKEPVWSAREIALLDRYGYLTPVHIGKVLREHGFTRSVTGISLMRKRRMSHKASPYYSVSALSHLFGIDHHAIDRFITFGWMKTTQKGTRRGAKQRGDIKLVHKDEIRRFIYEHPMEFELKKVDQMWFLDLVTEGKVKMVEPSKRLSKRSEGQLISAPREWGKKRRAASNSASPSNTMKTV